MEKSLTMNDEKTIYDDDVRKNQSQSQDMNKVSETTQEAKDVKEKNVTIANVANKPVPNKKPMWKRVAIGAGTGFAAGIAVTTLTSGSPQDSANEQHQDDGNNTYGDETHPAWVDGEVGVASSVNDNMSFGEAFEAARAEVGAGGVFEWHGYIYNTYYENEWENMSAADKAEFGSHFSWNQHHNDMASSHHQESDSSDEVAATIEEPIEGEDMTDIPEDADILATGCSYINHEVEILGVSHDDDTGANIAGMMIDGHEAFVLDVDGDMTFDIIGVDLNNDHQIDETEMSDISDAGIDVDGFDEQQADIAMEYASFDGSIDA